MSFVSFNYEAKLAQVVNGLPSCIELIENYCAKQLGSSYGSIKTY